MCIKTKPTDQEQFKAIQKTIEIEMLTISSLVFNIAKHMKTLEELNDRLSIARK